MKDRKFVHCGKRMVEAKVRDGWDVYYAHKCVVCNNWVTSLIPVSEKDR